MVDEENGQAADVKLDVDLGQLSPQERTGISIRAIITGAFLCLLLSIAAPYNLTNINGSYLALDHNAAGAIALFFIFVAGVNFLLRLIARVGGEGSFLSKLPFGRSEMLTIYVMLIVSSSLCTMGLGVQLPPIITAPYYFSSGGQLWSQALAKSGSEFPSWLMVSDPEAVQGFYSGLGAHEDFWPRFLDILARHWVKPLAYWALLLFAVYGAMICIAVIIRKQWMEREILVYPLTKVPLAMVESPARGSLVGPLFRNRLFWMGFAVPALMSTLLALSKYIPGFPAFKPQWNTEFLEGLLNLSFTISFAAIGFAFLINLEVSFSIWSFGLLGIILLAVLQYFGIRFNEFLGIYGAARPEVGGPLAYHLGEGALLVMAAYGLWIARSHLRDVFAKAFGRAKHVDDSNEILSYRSAVFGLIFCVLVMLIWLYCSGMSLWLAGIFLILAFVIFYVLSRVVAEGGLAAVVATSIAPTSCVSTLGSSAVGGGGLLALGLSYVWASDLRTFVMAPVANGLKVVEGIRRNRRRVVWGIFLAIAITFVFSLGLVICQAYRYGGINMDTWFFQAGPQQPYMYIQKIIEDQPGPNTLGWGLAAIGGGLMLFLLLMRSRCPWWPLHPIGLIVFGTWMMRSLWFSFFLAWMIKAILIKYGGPRLYTKAVPFFLGIIMGQFISIGLWVGIDFFTGMTQNSLFNL